MAEARESTHLSVKLPVFEGPLDLLLYLVEKNELDIYDIPIAAITHQYLEHLQFMEELNLEIAGEFILMAASLIRLKAQMLLPRPEIEGEAVDPRTELVEALLEYQKYKRAAEFLAKKEEEERKLATRRDFSFVERRDEVILEKSVNLFDLVAAFQKILGRLPSEAPSTYEIDYTQVSLEERAKIIRRLVAQKQEVEFEELFVDLPVRLIMVVTFLAVLELAKRQEIYILQPKAFGPLVVRAGSQLDSASIEEENEPAVR
ncbi:MAG: segregation/condensation protein A [candidate division Zixibacteria bacterium]|nr:segregation/condensation protein A [candidate division Zixibacteria bacterium]MCI0597298.1 segregation/condensation protein A [candidate division Zixibacteria bacterium]